MERQRPDMVKKILERNLHKVRGDDWCANSTKTGEVIIMSATVVLEKNVCVGVKRENEIVEKRESAVCSCGMSHMSSQNAVCRACSSTEAAK